MNLAQTGPLTEVEGDYYGMQTFDQALLDHIRSGRVAMDGGARGRHEPA
jgi:twitching motility protein PilT